MYYITFKLKNALIVLFAILLAGSFFLPGVGVINVFKTSERKIPIYSVEREDNGIALTFNCAWDDRDIDRIIEALSKSQAQATFFLVGEWAEKYPESAKKIANAGFEIGNHSYNHAHYNKMNKADILEDIEKGDRAIEAAVGRDVTLFRGPYGEYNNDVVSACDESGRTYIQWSCDSIDYKASSKDEITSRVLSKVKSGDIILMHTGTDFTADALEDLISKLKEEYTLLPVSELIYNDNYTIDFSGRQHKK